LLFMVANYIFVLLGEVFEQAAGLLQIHKHIMAFFLIGSYCQRATYS